MNNLISKYNIDEEFEKLQNNENDLFTIKEQIAYAFPGSYGIFISLHFGRFLNGTIDTKEKKDAFDAIVSYLNNLDMHISEKLSEYMEEIFKDEIDIAKLSEVQHNGILEILNNTDEYLEQNQKFFEEYIDFRTSDEFKNIPSFDFLNAMLDFQKNSGYKEVFIENMKKLSPEYAEYIVKLEEANRIFIEKFPKANNLDFI